MCDIRLDSIDKGFSKISNEYELLNVSSFILKWKRNKVRKHQIRLLEEKPCSILEINCGTGIDAIELAKSGHRVLATDISKGMIDSLMVKLNSQKNNLNINCEVLSYHNLREIKDQFDHIFSNFGGLNFCSENDLKNVFDSIQYLLKPNGTVTFVIMPKISPWEWLRLLKLDKRAFRRLKNNTYANIEGEKIRIYYHSHRQIVKLLNDNFTNFKVENLCFFGPTGNSNFFNIKNPFFYQMIELLDNISSHIGILKGYGDYYIFSAQKRKLSSKA